MVQPAEGEGAGANLVEGGLLWQMAGHKRNKVGERSGIGSVEETVVVNSWEDTIVPKEGKVVVQDGHRKMLLEV